MEATCHHPFTDSGNSCLLSSISENTMRVTCLRVLSSKYSLSVTCRHPSNVPPFIKLVQQNHCRKEVSDKASEPVPAAEKQQGWVGVEGGDPK